MYDSLNRALWRFRLSGGLSQEDIDDLIFKTTVPKIVKHVDCIENLMKYLAETAHNQALNEIARRKRPKHGGDLVGSLEDQKAEIPTPDGTTPVDALAREELAKTLDAAITHRLNEQEQRMVIGVAWENKPQSRVAEEMGLNPKQAGSIWQRALRKLKAAFPRRSDWV
jgi:RNA polymerase sigma factor (sigma-70 family)